MSSVETIALTDYRTLTEACGLIDVSERGKLALTGADAKEFLQGQVSNDVVALRDGAGCYAALLTPKGKMLGDMRILDAGEVLLLDTERVALQALFNMIRRFSIGFDVGLHKRTLESGMLALVGPEALAVAGVADELRDAPEHAHVGTNVGGVASRAIRTDTGVDLVCDATDTAALSAALEQAGAVSVSADALNCLRIERGRPRYGVDMDDTVIPQEASLNARAVSFTKGCYVGQETVARLYYRGKPNRSLRGLRSAAPLQPGDQLSLNDKAVGQISSAAVSPRFGPIGLALVRREAPAGSVVGVGADGLQATVVELPFD